MCSLPRQDWECCFLVKQTQSVVGLPRVFTLAARKPRGACVLIVVRIQSCGFVSSAEASNASTRSAAVESAETVPCRRPQATAGQLRSKVEVAHTRLRLNSTIRARSDPRGLAKTLSKTRAADPGHRQSPRSLSGRVRAGPCSGI